MGQATKQVFLNGLATGHPNDYTLTFSGAGNTVNAYFTIDVELVQ